MIVLWGTVLGAGLALAVSPWVWPRRERAPRSSVTRPVGDLLAAAGLPDTRGSTVLIACVAAASLAGVLAWALTGIGVFAAVSAAAAAAAPFAWLRRRAIRLRASRRGLWPDVCDLLVASLRAGMSLPESVASLADSAPGDLRAPFAVFRDMLSASGHFDSSMRRLGERLADPIADRIVATLRMARQVGGTELTAVLRSLSASVRADAALRAEVDARQSWTRGAAVLGVSAPWVILVLLALRPEGADAYASPEGALVVIAGAVVSVVAYGLMLRLGRLPDPRRWTS